MYSYFCLKNIKGIDGLIERLKKLKKKPVEAKLKQEIAYRYLDYIHPSYFKAQQEATSGIVCAFCQKSEGEAKFDFCSVCKQVYYCSKDCQKKDWKANHKAVCEKLKEDAKKA